MTTPKEGKESSSSSTKAEAALKAVRDARGGKFKANLNNGPGSDPGDLYDEAALRGAERGAAIRKNAPAPAPEKKPEPKRPVYKG